MSQLNTPSHKHRLCLFVRVRDSVTTFGNNEGTYIYRRALSYMAASEEGDCQRDPRSRFRAALSPYRS
jgi:hypothetical protein